MRLPALAALGIAAYAVFLVATMPASFVAARAQSASDGVLQVSRASGTVWRGEAQAVLATPAGRIPLDALRWRFAPAALAGGRLAFHVEAVAGAMALRGEAARSPAAWEAREVTLEGDAAQVAAWLPLLGPWRPAGPLAGSAPRLAWDGEALAGEATLEWRNASLALSDVRPLGSYRAQFRGEGGSGRIAVATTDGPLRISGQGTVAAPLRLDFTGEARAQGPQAGQLQPLLDLFGPRRPDGSRALRWRLP